MSIPPATQRLLSSYDFNSTAQNFNDAPDEPHFTPDDLNEMNRDELINAVLQLQDRNDQHLRQIQSSLREQQAQAEAITAIELHLGIDPRITEGYHQYVALDHVITWTEVRGREGGLLVPASTLMGQATTRRLALIREHIRNSGDALGGMRNSAPLFGQSGQGGVPTLTPPIFCRHVLNSNIDRSGLGRASFTGGLDDPESPGQMLSMQQVALGFPIRELLESYRQNPNGEAYEQNDDELWRRMTGDLHHSVFVPEITNDQWNRDHFLRNWFRAMQSPHFEAARADHLANLQQQARRAVAAHRPVGLVCQECRYNRGTMAAQEPVVNWWREDGAMFAEYAEAMVARVREEDQEQTRREYEQFAHTMNAATANYDQHMYGHHHPAPAPVPTPAPADDEEFNNLVEEAT